MRFKSPLKIEQIINKIPGEMVLGSVKEIKGINDTFNCNPHDVIFIDNIKSIKKINTKNSLLIITTEKLYYKIKRHFNNCSFYLTDNPFNAFKYICSQNRENFYSDIDRLRSFPQNCNISHDSFVDSSCKLGKNITIYPGVFIGQNVTIGDNSIIFPNVTIYKNIRIGNNVSIHSGAVIGSDGFYFSSNNMERFPMEGTVIVSDYVEIGANTTIDRSSTNVTFIGEGTKIDNHVHIAHDVTIGTNCLIMAHVAIAGQVDIGNNVILRGMSGVLDNVSIADNTTILSKSGITKSTEQGKSYFGLPAETLSSYSQKTSKQKMLGFFLNELSVIKKILSKYYPNITTKTYDNSTIEIIKEISGIEQISLETQLHDVVDSLEKLELTLFIEEQFNIEIDSTELKEISTVKDLISLVNEKKGLDK